MKRIINTAVKIIILVHVFIFLPPLVFSDDVKSETVQTVRVGIYDNKPKIYMENGEVKGLFADIVDYIADRENWEVEYVHGT